MPVLFVSHGAPDTLLKAPAVVRGWERIGQTLRMHHRLPFTFGGLAMDAYLWQ
jgi:aromatic ring-opening dioxygenase catalytic subunit (LigB family)